MGAEGEQEREVNPEEHKAPSGAGVAERGGRGRGRGRARGRGRGPGRVRGGRGGRVARGGRESAAAARQGREGGRGSSAVGAAKRSGPARSNKRNHDAMYKEDTTDSEDEDLEENADLENAISADDDEGFDEPKSFKAARGSNTLVKSFNPAVTGSRIIFLYDLSDTGWVVGRISKVENGKYLAVFPGDGFRKKGYWVPLLPAKYGRTRHPVEVQSWMLLK